MPIEVINANYIDYLNSPFCSYFDLIIADPPFNIGQKYNGFNDKISDSEYRTFTRDWIIACWNKLKPGSAFVLHGSIEASRVIIVCLDELKLEPLIECEICWAYNFGQHTYNNFIQTHCRAIILRKPGEHRKWNETANMVPSKRLLMGDTRTTTAKYKGMVPIGTVWGVECNDDGLVTEPINGLPNWGRVQGNNGERRQGHPNQLPENYCSRFIAAYSNENDIVFDPFGGSGTTAICCKKMNRQCKTTEIGAWNCVSIKTSLQKLENVKL